MKYYKGMDISTLLEVERCGGKFYDKGEERELLSILKDYDVNALRVRLWNHPYSEEGKPYGAGTNDFEAAKKLLRRGKDLGFDILLDYHYSDFWADPGKQFVPKAWRGYSVEQLEQAVYDYTRITLNELMENDLLPEMIQVGNELSNGILWPTGRVPEYDNIARYVKSGIRAVRDVSRISGKDIKVMVHLDNGGKNELYRNWFDEYIHKNKGEDFDIIGLSYYPFWHGTLSDLANNMNDSAVRYKKELIVAEVSMGHTVEDYIDYEKLAPDKRKGMATKPELCEKVPFAMTKEGQSEFMKAFLQTLENVPEHKGRGFFYWEPAWLPVQGSGWATEPSLVYMKEKGPCGNEWANQALFDYDGNALPALRTIKEYQPK